jgi:hypothetical protein
MEECFCIMPSCLTVSGMQGVVFDQRILEILDIR